ncbi:hypothetical protein NDU88_005655 [Pleurodeles waltl]|uniref:Uncharacterized protein n=1 Tax=Pleurodeles waltl TaxID=8319 RepID=A0AAV7TCV4_PLEWA|nr:hypothetical protein NDU88_005655 [Pleurodeles waltl]
MGIRPRQRYPAGDPTIPNEFWLALEPLAAWVHGDALIQGISATGDHVLLYLTNPLMSTDGVLQVFRTFEDHSQNHTNWDKSCLCPLVVGVPDLPLGTVILVALEEFTYLGIYVMRDATKFLRRKIYDVLDRFQSDVSRLRTLPLSLVLSQNRGQKASDRPPEKPKEKEEPSIFTDADFKRFEWEYFGGGAGTVE